MARRCALIVANESYADARLSKLRAPARDAEALARVLGDPGIGGFDLDLAVNDLEHVLRRRIGKFFADRDRDDLLLLHMSCHGLKDDEGHLYFAAADTRVDELDATAVSADYVNRQMSRSRSRRIVLLLDCCYSGAFARGMTPRAGDSVDVKERFEGRGRAVLTASSAIEYSFEGDELSGRGNPSVFTSAVVRALETGDADRDRDSWISVNELYDYVYTAVREATPKQRPHMWLFDVEGDLHIARAVRGASSASAQRPAAAGLVAVAPSSRQGRAARYARRISGRRLGIAGVVVSLAIVAGVAAIVAAGGPTQHQSAGLSATVALTQPAPAPKTRLISGVGTRPFGVAADGDAYSVWVSDLAGGDVRRFDTGADNVIGRLPVGGQPSWLAIGAGSVWVPSRDAGTVTLLSVSRKLKATKTIGVGRGAYSVAVAGGTAWVVNADRNTVTRIETTTNRAEGPPTPVGRAPSGVAADADGAWVANNKSNTVTHIDTNGTVSRGAIGVGDQPNGVTVTNNGIVWVANTGSDSITRISATTGKVIGHPIQVGRAPLGITSGGGFVWVTDSADDDVRRLNPSTGSYAGKPIPVGRDPTSIAVSGNSAWVANSDDGSVTEIDF
jgi:DNA-binding beta-propeller fold protein YncE